jgi:Flp pilus assembly protein TadB
MKVYNVLPSPLTGDKPIQITRGEIDEAKQKTKAGGLDGYSLMLDLLSPPAAMARACLVPGTNALRWTLNGCIIVGMIMILAVLVLLLFRLWVWSAVAAIVAYILVFRLQTTINHEIGARLFALDQHLDLDNVAEESTEPYCE